jgi:biopolymer transport protein ExbD
MINIQSSKKRSMELDLIPLINIVFLLLIFFMLTSSSISSSLKAELPAAQSSIPIKKKNSILKISLEGLVELNGKPVLLSELGSRLKVELTQEKSKIIEVHGDKNIEFQIFGKIIGDARNAGAEDFVFATKKSASSD